MVCNVCNGICDSFVMVLEFSVMVLLFISAGLHHFFNLNTSLYIIMWSNKNMVHLWFPWLQEPWFFFFFFFKPWLTFVSEHGISERILDALVVVKLPTLKHVIKLKTPISFTGLWMWSTWKWRTGFVFIFVCFFLVPHCWCLFMSIVIHNRFAFSHKHGASGRGCGNGVSHFFFFWNWNGGAPLGVGALRKLHTLCIESGGTATVGGVITSVA